MAEPQLSVRSARARDLAYRLPAVSRTIADIVERALEAYEVREAVASPQQISMLVFPTSRERTSISKG